MSVTHLPRLAGLIFDRHHYVTVSAAEAVAQGLAERMEIGARFAAAPEQRKPNGAWKGYRATASGIAIVDFQGELVNRGAYLGADSGLISYEGVRETARLLAADDTIKAVIYDCDCPGGLAAGMTDAAESVRALAAVKHVVAVADDMMASAAYGVLAGASRIVATELGAVGSIGVVMIHRDLSKKLENEGIVYTIIQEGDHKTDGNPYMALPADVRAAKQADAKLHMDAFVRSVAKCRPSLTEAAIRETQARIYRGADAVKAGLADSVGTFDSVLADLERQIAAGTLPTPKRSAVKGHVMTEKTHTQADIDAAVAAATTSATQAGATAERARIGAILTSTEATGRADQAAHLAFKTSMPATDAVSLLATGAKVDAKPAASATTPVKMTAGLEEFAAPGGAPKAKGPETQKLSDIYATRRKA